MKVKKDNFVDLNKKVYINKKFYIFNISILILFIKYYYYSFKNCFTHLIRNIVEYFKRNILYFFNTIFFINHFDQFIR